ncbi:GntR family transcriptional regulator [Streptomyces sp. SID685]|uniref:GntR family transcriptional regulator n=1 Tax=Streptomyces sp. SID685 TaxID=2690322 RepID=UPI001F011F5E|nr:GntR family transcriptional regulator [Streptomyces sp. SID685]
MLTELPAQYGVGYQTVRSAISLLQQEGLVVEPGEQHVAQHDLQVTERFEEGRGEVAVPPVQRERGGGVAGAGGQVGVQRLLGR